jgi:deoxyribose-phosphate aldolase
MSRESVLEVSNPGISLDLDWIRNVRVDTDDIDRKAKKLAAEVAVQKSSVELLLRAIACTDLTTLADDDTEERVRQLCVKARQPLPPALLARFANEHPMLRVAAVCVFEPFVRTALQELQGSGIKVATVSADFPKGLAPLEERMMDIHRAVGSGAHEIDVVIKRAHVLEANWQSLYDEVAAFKAACAPRHMKVILATGELETLDNIARASFVAMMAGADFIKTSTGKETVNATIPAALAMTRAIRDYAAKTGVRVGFKAAGGIRTAKQALEYMEVMREELGEEWLQPNRFRIGASSMLGDIEKELARLHTD